MKFYGIKFDAFIRIRFCLPVLAYTPVSDDTGVFEYIKFYSPKMKKFEFGE